MRSLFESLEGALDSLLPNWRELEFGRVQTHSDWILPLVILAVIVLFVWLTYRRDSVELPRPVGWLLAGLRTAAFLGLFLIWLQPQWPNVVERTEHSRVLVMLDTSLSMQYPAQEIDGLPSGPSRAERVRDMLAQSPLLNELQKKHDVVLMAFDQDPQDPRPLLSLDKAGTEGDDEADGEDGPAEAQEETKDAGEKGSEKADATKSAAEESGEKPWLEAVAPRGNETRLGQSLRRIIFEERAKEVAGIVVISDFGQNAGVDPTVARRLAAEANIPIYTVGLGTNSPPKNVHVELNAPNRAYQNDPYQVEGLIRAQGYAGQLVNVELASRSTADAGGAEAEEIEGNQEVILGDDGSEATVKFTLNAEHTGRLKLRLRVKPPRGDQDPEDNEDEAEIEIIDRKPHVLLVAGGPTREYRFLRDMLYRSGDSKVDVFLQTSRPGVSQEADEILTYFPSSIKELEKYECVIAIDPDWFSPGPSNDPEYLSIGPDKANVLADWVEKEAGGLIVVAGPIHTRRWTQRPEMQSVLAMYPVEFHKSFTDLADLDTGEYGAKEPSALEFTSEGVQAEFLWLTDSRAASLDTWTDEFEGVYGYYAVRRPKPAATVYARFDDPKGRPEDERVYFAEHYFGRGKVFYLASGEMWRLRALDPAYFERFYTKVIQHVTEGRLSRDSSRGELMVDATKYTVGSTVSVTARLRDEQLKPLVAPSVTLDVIPPDKRPMPVQLESNTEDPTQAGLFRGQFTVREEGPYYLELAVPGSDEVLRRPPIRVSLPDLERDNRRRNDDLIKELADETGGKWYLGLASMLEGDGERARPVYDEIKASTRTIREDRAPTRFWDSADRSMWAMFIICGLLCAEWLVRRVSKLA